MANRIIVSLGLGFLASLGISVVGKIFYSILRIITGYESVWFWWIGGYIFLVGFVYFFVMKPETVEEPLEITGEITETKLSSEDRRRNKMENKKISPILYVITTLLVINLLGTLWLINKVVEQPSELASRSKNQENLPDYLTKEVRKEIYNKYEEAFNSQDNDSFWNLFSDLAKSRMNKNQVDKTYKQLLDMFGRVSNGVFKHYEFTERQGNLRTFVLHYNVDLDEAKIGNKGELKITITDNGKEYGIVSCFMGFVG